MRSTGLGSDHSRPLPRVRAALPVRVANYRAGAQFGPRRLREFEFLWLLAGSMDREFMTDDPLPRGGLTPGVSADAQPRTRTLHFRPGMLSLSRRGMTEVYRWDPQTHSSHAYIHFEIDEIASLPPAAEWPDTRDMSHTPVLDGLCNYLLDLGTMPGPEALERTQHCLALLLDLHLHGPFGDPAPTSAWLEPMIQLVGVRWAEAGVQSLPVADLAAAMGMSRGHLSHRVSRRYGCGPAQVVELVRLARAAAALRTEDTSVSRVARATGYANPYHFSRRFTLAYGVPPTTFQKSPGIDPYGPLRQHGLLSATRRLLQATNPN